MPKNTPGVWILYLQPDILVHKNVDLSSGQIFLSQLEIPGGGIELGLEMHIWSNNLFERRYSECTGPDRYIAYLHMIEFHFVYQK